MNMEELLVGEFAGEAEGIGKKKSPITLFTINPT
jgi:hypothetical protein